jgi:nucleoside-diphosphate-sugar epimerase
LELRQSTMENMGLNGMRILVTGHLGYIGTVLVPMLQAEGYEVTGLDTDLYRGCTFGSGLAQVPNIAKDIRDVQLDDLKDFNAICHLAALSNDSLGNLNPELTDQINYKASVRLAELAKTAGTRRFLFASSCSCYGSTQNEQVTEEDTPDPLTPYAKSKVSAERDLSSLADDNFSPIILRNATAYGPSPRLRLDLVLNDFVACAFTLKKIVLKSDGSSWRPILHVEDIARAFRVILAAPRDIVHNETFNVGSTEYNFQIKDIAGIVRNIMPNYDIEFADRVSTDRRNYRINCDKMTKLLPSFKPQCSPHFGVRQLFEAYSKVGMSAKDFKGPKYRRIDCIRNLLQQNALDKELRFKVPVGR